MKFSVLQTIFAKNLKRNRKHSLPTENGSVRRKSVASLSDSEIITILVCFHFGSFRNFKHYYIYFIKEHLKAEFPKAVSYNRFIELEVRVVTPMMLFLKLCAFSQCTVITYIDSTPIRVCNNKRIKRNKVFKGLAALGKSTMGWFYGFKLHLIVNEREELLNFAITKGNIDDRNPEMIQKLTKTLFEKLFADKGYISATLFETLFCDGIHLVTGIKRNMKNQLMSLKDKVLLRKRSVIETINDELKIIGHAEHSRHRSAYNFIMYLMACLLAYSFFPKKASIDIQWEETNQLMLF